jgi:uncharacterized protein YggE
MLIFAASLLLLVVPAIGNAQATQAGGVTVNGVGTAYGAPDTAVLDLGVSLYHADVAEGMAQVDQRMQAIREALVAAGVDVSDIRTTGLSVWREQQYDQQGNPTSERYNIWHNYNVTVRDPEQVGAVINAAVAAGANNVGGVSFTIADPGPLEREAREAAIADARARAEHLAELMGVTLGEPVAISEGVQGVVPMVRNAAFEMGAGGGVATGQLAVSVNVTVTFALGGSGQE